MVTATIMNKNRRVRLIFNWYISKIHPLCSQNIAWKYNMTYFDLTWNSKKIIAIVLL